MTKNTAQNVAVQTLGKTVVKVVYTSKTKPFRLYCSSTPHILIVLG